MKALIAKPVNDTQSEFNALCEKGGGVKGGPARGKVLELLRSSGKRLNGLATREAHDHIVALPDANPWHVCFAVGLSWGHLAQIDINFTSAVCGVLESWNATDLATAQSYHMERGAEPIRQSLTGAHVLFGKVKLPSGLPTTLDQLQRAQERWLSPILNKAERPPLHWLVERHGDVHGSSLRPAGPGGDASRTTANASAGWTDLQRVDPPAQGRDR